jgi:hypothetical protein
MRLRLQQCDPDPVGNTKMHIISSSHIRHASLDREPDSTQNHAVLSDEALLRNAFTHRISHSIAELQPLNRRACVRTISCPALSNGYVQT